MRDSGAVRGPRLRRQRVHLLHLRKTGGTALRAALEDHTVTARYRLLLHSHGKTIQDIPQGEKFVFFLRDPVMRFCSGFYSRQRKGAPRHYADWRPVEARLFERFQTPNELACALANNERHAITGMSAVYHFKPYSTWYGDLDYFRSRLDDLLFVGYQESLEQDYAALRELLGVPPVARLPDDEVESHRTPLDLDYHIDEPGLAALQRWYAQDYVFLALCRSLPAGIRS